MDWIYCEPETNDFVPMTQTVEYSNIEIAVNRHCRDALLSTVQEAVYKMNEYIDRKRAISDVEYEFGRVGAEVIARVPISDVSVVQHGQWVRTEGNLYRCSVCEGYPSYIPAQCRTSKFCPNCGAKMDMK